MTRTTTARRFYIDVDATNDGVVLRRVPVQHKVKIAQPTSTHQQSTANVLGLGRLIRSRIVRRID